MKHLQSFFQSTERRLGGKTKEILVLVKTDKKRALKGIKRSIPDWENMLDYYLWLWAQLTELISRGSEERKLMDSIIANIIIHIWMI
ncbi:MAG: hypothetical protein IPJ86_00095 [Bacteroidetes bacterium]|nr:hypothetical protein [Bacteroidota bacterium]